MADENNIQFGVTAWSLGFPIHQGDTYVGEGGQTVQHPEGNFETIVKQIKNMLPGSSPVVSTFAGSKPDDLEFARYINALAIDEGVKIVGTGFRPQGPPLYSLDKAEGTEALKEIIAMIRWNEVAGTLCMDGPYHIVHGVKEVAPPNRADRSEIIPVLSKRQFDIYMERLKGINQIAYDSGVNLAMEPLQRGETNITNKVSQILEILEYIEANATGINLDISHQYIEEANVKNAILEAYSRKKVKNQHLGENIRCEILGNGECAKYIPWIIQTARKYSYDGPMVIEQFCLDLAGMVDCPGEKRPGLERTVRSVEYLKSALRAT